MKRTALCIMFCVGLNAESLQAAIVYGIDLTGPEFLTFDTASPLVQTVINPYMGDYDLYALDFDSTATTLYAIDNTASRAFGTIDTGTGVFTPQATVTNITSGHTITGMAVDPIDNTIFVSSSNAFESSLYRLNPGTGVAALVGTQSTAPTLIDLAIRGNGQMYGVDISTDALYSIDKTTAAATLIGSLGLTFNPNYAQGMDFDYSSDTLFAALYGGTGYSYFASLDLTTGAANILAGFDSFQEMEIAIRSPAAVVPIPGAVLLGALGMSCAGGWLRRHKAL